MTISPTSLLAEIEAGHNGPAIPAAKRAYFQQRLRNRVFSFVVSRFAEKQKDGLTKAILARRIEKSPEQITRWLGSPSNLTLDVASDLLLGIAAEEFEVGSTSPLMSVDHNYSLFHMLSEGAAQSAGQTDYAERNDPRAASAMIENPQRSMRRGALEATSGVGAWQ